MALPSMAFTAVLSQYCSFSCHSRFPPTSRRNPLRLHSIRAVKAAEPGDEKTTQTNSEESSSNAQPSTKPSKFPKKPVYSSEFWNFITISYLFWKLKGQRCSLSSSLIPRFSSLGAVKKGQIVRVDKEKYLNSVNVSISWPFYWRNASYFFLYIQINSKKTKEKYLVLVLVHRRFFIQMRTFCNHFLQRICLFVAEIEIMGLILFLIFHFNWACLIFSFSIYWNTEIFDSNFQYLSVGHPPYYKGLDYIYEDRGEVDLV